MKVKKDSINISNKKKNALPSSKLLKPKKFKSSMKKSGDAVKPAISKNKLKLAKLTENISEQFGASVELSKLKKVSNKIINHKNSSDLKEERVFLTSSPNKLKKLRKGSQTMKIPTLFDFVTSQGQNTIEKVNDKANNNSSKHKSPRPAVKKSPEKQRSPKVDRKDSKKCNNPTESTNKPKLKASSVLLSKDQIKKENIIGGDAKTNRKNKHDVMKKPSEKQHLILPSKIVVKDQNKENVTMDVYKCNLKTSKVAAVTKGLLKHISETSASKLEMLDVGEPVYLQVECIKIPICATKQLRFKLPHPLTDESSDVLLITADLKGHKIYPDRAVDHYEELLAKLQINFITKVMPLRMVKKEYSQYELKRKLVDQFDVILADSRIIKSLPAILGKFVLYKRKMPIPVNFNIGESKLKKHLEEAVCKTQMTVKSNGHSSIVQIGHSKMGAKEMAANVVEVAKSLEKLYPGGWKNIRSLVIKTAKSTSLPVYLSLLSPNEVRIPVEIKQKPAAVEDELSTMPGHRVIVTADGNVILKKIEEDLKIDDSKDEEILEEAQKYLESSKTVRYDESSDEEKNEEKENSDSDDEGDAITEAMEKKLLNKYEKKAKVKKSKGDEEEKESEDEEEEEEEGESEEETEIVPKIGKKRKTQGNKKQSGPPAKKQLKTIEPKGKHSKENSSKDKKPPASPGFKKPQPRGARGGKKNKMSKDQRKALIKRRKAGKK